MLSPGQIIADRYVIVELIGEGGLAQVWKVRHLELGGIHALKLLLFRKPRLAERLILEGRIQAQLKHPNIVSVTDVVRHGGQVGLVMEFIDGVSLATWLEANAPLDVDRALELFAPILAGVRQAHDAGVLHRDLKPANILLARQGRGYIPKVSDFGIAKVVEGSIDGMETRTGAVMGTPGYLAPEQAIDASKVDRRVDLFALGAILYEMLTAQRAYDANDVFIPVGARVRPISEVRKDVPAGIEEAVYKAICLDPAGRFDDVPSFAAALFAGRPELLEQAGSNEPRTEPLALSIASTRHDTVRPTLAPAADPGEPAARPRQADTYISPEHPPADPSSQQAAPDVPPKAPSRPPRAEDAPPWESVEAPVIDVQWPQSSDSASADGAIPPPRPPARSAPATRRDVWVALVVVLLGGLGLATWFLRPPIDESTASAEVDGPPPPPGGGRRPTLPSAGLGWRNAGGDAAEEEEDTDQKDGAKAGDNRGGQK